MSAYQTLIPLNFLAVGLGAALGAWARWLAGLWLNIESWPWGTLAVNLVGGYLIGLLLALVTAHPEWPAWVRLGAITGFLGGLTTFSTFSAETVAMLERGAYGSALGYAAISLAGSLLLTGQGWRRRRCCAEFVGAGVSRSPSERTAAGSGGMQATDAQSTRAPQAARGLSVLAAASPLITAPSSTPG